MPPAAHDAPPSAAQVVPLLLTPVVLVAASAGIGRFGLASLPGACLLAAAAAWSWGAWRRVHELAGVDPVPSLPTTCTRAEAVPPTHRFDLSALRERDPGVSRFALLDRLRTLYRACRSDGSAEDLEAWVDPSLRARLPDDQPRPGLVVEAVRLLEAGPRELRVRVHASWMAPAGGGLPVELTEVWRLQLAAGTFTPTPDRALSLTEERPSAAPDAPAGPDALAAPGTSAAPDTRAGPDAPAPRPDWRVVGLELVEEGPRPPLAPQGVPGWPDAAFDADVRRSDLEARLAAFAERQPDFTWRLFLEQVKARFLETAKAIRDADPDLLPRATQAWLLEAQRTWIERERAAGVTRATKGPEVRALDVVDVEADPHGEAVTVAILSQREDEVRDAHGRRLGPSGRTLRRDLWTFYQSRRTGPGGQRPGWVLALVEGGDFLEQVSADGAGIELLPAGCGRGQAGEPEGVREVRFEEVFRGGLGEAE